MYGSAKEQKVSGEMSKNETFPAENRCKSLVLVENGLSQFRMKLCQVLVLCNENVFRIK